MKLSEIKRPYYPTMDGVIDDLFEEVFTKDVKVEVEYYHEPEDHTDHPYGSTYAREYHHATTDLINVTLKEKAEFMDDDGEPSGKFEEPGTDLMKQKYWTKSMGEMVIEWVEKQLKG